MEALPLARTFVCALFAVVFLQSGLDKIVDWKGNLTWLRGHFEKTFFGSAVPALLFVVAVMELFTCLVSAFAIVVIWSGGPAVVPTVAMSLTCLTLLMLLGGQRFAKDYPGAATLTTYFGVALLGLALMHDWK